MKKITIINEIYIILNIGIELELDINYDEFILMFEKIIENDIRFIKLCPSELEDEIIALKEFIDSYSDKVTLLNEIKKFIIAFSSIIAFETCKVDLDSLAKDKLYYKAVVNKYYIEDLLIPSKDSTFEKFKNEFYQIGVLIGKYYKDNNDVIVRILTTKITELFNRYNFNYSLPVCCY